MYIKPTTYTRSVIKSVVPIPVTYFLHKDKSLSNVKSPDLSVIGLIVYFLFLQLLFMSAILLSFLLQSTVYHPHTHPWFSVCWSPSREGYSTVHSSEDLLSSLPQYCSKTHFTRDVPLSLMVPVSFVLRISKTLCSFSLSDLIFYNPLPRSLHYHRFSTSQNIRCYPESKHTSYRLLRNLPKLILLL